MTERVLAVAGVTKVFDEGRQRVEVLRGITMEVSAGEVVALEGPSGSGKTTLLSIMGCILTPTSGEVEVASARVRRADEAGLRDVRRRSIGFVFQQYNLFPALTALENVEYSLNVRGLGGREAHDEARRALGRVGLAERSGFLPRDLSGGQKQRVAIARAIAGRPPVLLAAGPPANLDPATGPQVLDLFRDLGDGLRLGGVVEALTVVDDGDPLLGPYESGYNQWYDDGCDDENGDMRSLQEAGRIHRRTHMSPSTGYGAVSERPPKYSRTPSERLCRTCCKR